ncbi:MULTISPECIES: sensor histidine kinase [Aerococcus]|uniref:sensor histidine kinase n=1 Tax=Aerococcus TaxID=1375 RepID=UPI000DCD3438|nr:MULTISPECIES: HAMP domain-containing sensor histidine kinase [Aerococcus]KAA9234341.1 HAMP domain-containing histidine kinase [Aerococcus mictus]MBU5610383.1 HAMP domain-containing histidine kinase [Aerococcus urinae]MDK6291533.1 HAMP domain-containing sensor histidine kinase [Aerococcus urinae]MDK6374571.1 HAMP domain-containing sensor histidine kinase [Aerococcus urinae]MDK6420872.1 HAMP domain-containing sensor histidine kinase [Aerococcus urinae]
MLYLIVAFVIIMILLIILYLSQKEVAYLSRQLDKINKRKTNQLIRQRLYSPAFDRLTKSINASLTKERDLRLALEKKDRLQQELLLNLSHDIRTPLTSIKGYLQLLGESNSEVERKHYLNNLSQRLDRLTLLLDQLFTYMTIEDDDYPLALEKIDLKENLVNHFLAYYNSFQAQEMDLDFSLPDRILYIQGDTHLLQRMFENLIKNVLVHGDKKVEISLDDRGFLVIKNDLAHSISRPLDDLFQRFQQGQDYRQSGGSGLGLNIVQSAAKKMGIKMAGDIQNEQFMISLDFSEILLKEESESDGS